MPASLPGRALLREAGHPPGAIFAQYADQRYTLRTVRWKLILTNDPQREELYDLSADPRERHNLAARHPTIANALRSELERRRRALAANRGAQGPSIQLAQEEVEALRALGYLGGRSTEAEGISESRQPGAAADAQ